MQCELCGKEGETKDVLIEGVEMSVCTSCTRHGKELKKPVLVRKKKLEKQGSEKVIVKNYSEIIKKKREELGLKQEDFAKLVNEKTSTMNSIEAGNLKPTIDLADKLKKKFGIKLVEEEKKPALKVEKPKSGSMTIGDLIGRK